MDYVFAFVRGWGLGPVAVEEGADVGPGGGYVDCGELAGCVFVLGVDYYERAVGGAGGGGVNAD